MLKSFSRAMGAALLVACAPTLLAQEQIKLGGREVVVWRPKTSALDKSPLVIFSHGFGGCATQSNFLTEGMAAHGYFVVAPNHKDARCGERGALARPDQPFAEPQKWTDASFADRRDDVRAVVQALRDSPQFRDQIDFTRVGLAGHSLGGYTVLGLAGGWTSWKMANVKAVLALSPYADPFLVQHRLAGIAAPIMYQGGTLDVGITPSLERPGGVYDESPTPKFFIDFRGAGHFAWTNLRSTIHDDILGYALPFLDRYVRGVHGANQRIPQQRSVQQLRFDTTAAR